MDSRGKIQLGLSLVLGENIHQINEINALNRLQYVHDLQKELQYECLESAFDNMKAFLELLITSKKTNGIRRCRKILSNDESNLNALLTYIFVSLGSRREIKDKIDKCKAALRNEENKNTILSKACFEIGFALLFLSEELTFRRLFTEVDKGEEYLKQIFSDSRADLFFMGDQDLKQSESLTSISKRSAGGSFFVANVLAAKYLKEGLNRRKTFSRDEEMIWIFFLAKAYSRAVDKAVEINVANDLQEKWCKKALELLFKVCEIEKNKGTILQAKAYAYIGQIIYTKKHMISALLENWLDPDFLKNPLSKFEKAKQISPNDRTVLVRFGKFFLDEQKDFDLAELHFNRAIELYPNNWLAYKFRMTTFRRKYQQRKKKSESKYNANLLEQAARDGEKCCSINATTCNLLEYGRILFMLAIDRDQIENDYVREALDVFNRIDVDLGDHKISRVFEERAKCHHKIREIEEALLYSELAVYTFRIEGYYGLPRAFTQFYFYLTDYIVEAAGTSKLFGIRRLKTVTKHYIERYEKFQKKENDVYRGLYNLLESKLGNLHLQDSYNVINTLERCNPQNLREYLNELKNEAPEHETLIKETHVANKMILLSLNAVQKWTKLLAEEKNNETSERPVSSVPLSTGHMDSGTDTKNDFFVLHSETENDWVACCFLLQLEHSRRGYKGFIPERDFKPDRSVLENIAEGINSSRKIFLVVSKDTPEDFYNELDRNEVLVCLQLFNDGEEKDIYIVNLGSEKLPKVFEPFKDNVINWHPHSWNLSEVVEVLRSKTQMIRRPKVKSVPKPGPKKERPEKIMTIECEVDENPVIEAKRLLRYGFQQPPIYGSVKELKKAEEILKFGCPLSDFMICYEGFVISYDPSKRISKWVAYHLTPDNIVGSARRANHRYHMEDRIPEVFTAKPADYDNDKTITRGHRHPAAEAHYDEIVMYDTFNLTNILPEKRSNRIWASLEIYIREKVLNDFKDLRIFTGPIFGNDEDITAYRNLKESGVAVPTYFFKIVLAETTNQETKKQEVISGSFIVKNEQNYGYKVIEDKDEETFKRLIDEIAKDASIKTIEAKTGIDFSRILPPENIKEDLLERCPFITAEFCKDYEYAKKREDKNKSKGKQSWASTE